MPTEICRQQFFSQRGLSGISGSLLKKSAISLSIILHTDFLRLWRDMPVWELIELMADTEEVLSEIGKE